MAYQINTQSSLNRLNQEYYKLHPLHINLTWAGCSIYINQGLTKEEPLGTATSMIECDGCEAFDKCKLKKDTRTWFYNEHIHIDRIRLFRELLN